MTESLLLVAIVGIVCVVAGKVIDKVGVPALLIFIVLGMMFGSDGIFNIYFDNYELAEQISVVALLFIMFYGGFGTKWSVAKPVALKAGILSSVGVVMTAFIVGFFCRYVLGMGMLQGLLLGSVIASTDAASVFSILRTKNLNLTGGMASLLEIESGSNDPFAYTMTTIVLGLMSVKGDINIPYLIFSQIVYGVLVGAIIGVLGAYILSKVNFNENGLQFIFMVGIAFVSYALPVMIGGNGFLSVYITGIILGNSRILHKIELVHFFDGITGIMQMVLFFMLGLLSFPSKLIVAFVPAVLIILFLTFVARPISVAVILTPFRVPVKEQMLIAWAGLRGAASIVFAIMTFISPAYGKDDIVHIVFCIALLSVAFQGSLLPFVAKKLGVIGNDNSTLKTFNDYQEEKDIHLIEVQLLEGHPWIDNTFAEINMPIGMIAVMIRRGEEDIVPNGNTTVLQDDTLIVTSVTFKDNSNLNLVEINIGKKHLWVNKMLSEIELPEGALVTMIKRKHDYITPTGETIIRQKDIVIICSNNIMEIQALT